MRIFRYLFATLVITSMTVAYAQQGTPSRLFDQHKYREYLQSYKTIVTAITDNPTGSFDQLVALAVAIEKTDTWQEKLGIEIKDGVKPSSDASRYFNVVAQLLKGDTHDISKLLEGKAPNIMALLRASQMFRDHGYALAANSIAVLTPDLPGKRVLYLVSIPKEERAPVLDTLLNQIKDPPNHLMLARTALDMFLHPPLGVNIDSKALYDIVLKISQGTSIVSFDTAQQLLQGGKESEAVQMVTQLTTEQPTDELLQLRTARFLLNVGNQAAATTLYRQALVSVPEPHRREVRLDYLEYLQRQKKKDVIAKLLTGKDVLLAGDAALVNAQYENAAKLYVGLITNSAAPIEKRLAAWAGLLDADPGQALTLGKDLISAIAKSDQQVPPALVVWTGRQLWSVMSREIPAKPGSFVMGWRQHFRPVHAVKDWEIPAAALATQLLDSDLEACLRPDTRYTPDSFRYPAVMLFALSGNARKAADVLTKSLDYQIPPPPGGWKIFDGSPTPDTNKPRTRTTPTPIELKKLTMLVLEDLSRCPKANEHVPALSAIIAKNIAEQLAKDTKDEDIRLHLQELASVVKLTVTALDPLPQPLRTDLPPPPAHKVDMTCFTPIDTVIRKVLTSDNVAKNGLLLVNEGLRDALLTASNPELLTTLTDLSSYTIQRYGEASKQPKFAIDERKKLVDYLAARPVYDMQQYINRLNGDFVRGVNE